MDRNKTIGQMIGKIRSENNETQQQLADALGVKRELITYWENGTPKREIKAALLAEIAKRYNVSADYLLGLTEYKSQDKSLTAVCDFTGLSEDAITSFHNLTKRYSKGAGIRFLNYLLTSSAFGFISWSISAIEPMGALLNEDVIKSETPFSAESLKQAEERLLKTRLEAYEAKEAFSKLVDSYVKECGIDIERIQEILTAESWDDCENGKEG